MCRILSSYLLTLFYLMRKIAKVLRKPSSDPVWETPNHKMYSSHILDSFRNYRPSSQKLGDWIDFCIKRLRTFFELQQNIQNLNQKIKKKHVAVDDLTKADLMVPLLGRSNLAGRFL
jgi:hypothetical protein